MVGSFYVLAMLAVLRVTVGTLTGKFSWMTKVIPYLNYSVYGGLGLLGLFVIIAIFKAIFGGGRRGARSSR